jgi:hypothetical protein
MVGAADDLDDIGETGTCVGEKRSVVVPSPNCP